MENTEILWNIMNSRGRQKMRLEKERKKVSQRFVVQRSDFSLRALKDLKQGSKERDLIVV